MIFYFTNTISNLEDTYLTENSLNNFKKQLDNLITPIINNIAQRNPVTIPLKSYENEFMKILREFYGNNLIKNYFKIYANKTFLEEKGKKFYDDLSQSFDEFKTIFYDKYFYLEFKNYVEKPNEILTKFNQIADFQKNYFNNPAEQLNEFILYSLNNLISKSYDNLKNIVKNNYNKLSSNINKSNTSLVNEIDNLFNSLFSFIETEKNKNKDKNYIKSILNLPVDNPFGLKELSLQYENDFLKYKINAIKSLVETNFKERFCKSYGNICSIKLLFDKDLHNYNMAKIRNEIEHYIKIQNYAKNLITDQLLVDLNENKFNNLILKNIDFSPDSLKNSILNFVKTKNEEELEILNPFFDQFKNAYKQVLEENLNNQVITNKIEILANFSFENKIEIINSNFIDLIKNKFKVFEENWSQKQFYLHSSDLQNSYNTFLNGLKKNLFSIKNFVDGLNLGHIIIFNTTNNYKKLIQNNLEEILGNIKENSKEHEKCILLNLTFDLVEIGEDAIDELKIIYYSHIENEINRIYTMKFEELKTNIKNLIDKNVNEILNTLNSEYEKKFLTLSEKSNPECQSTSSRPESDAKCKNRSKVQLKTLESDLTTSINNYANSFKSQIETNFNQIQITQQIVDLEKENFQILEQNFNYEKIENKVKENANNFKMICAQNLEKEKTEFQTEINNVIKKEFTENINNFANSHGKNFMEENYNKIYTFSIKNKFKFINSVLTNTNSYINNDLIKNIDKIELNLKDLLLNIFKNTDINIQNYSQNNIKEKLIIKINNLIEISNSIIYKKFSETVSNAFNDKNFISSFSENIYNLIPKYFDYSFTLSLKKDFSDLMNKMSNDYLISPLKNSINIDIYNIKNNLNNQEKNLEEMFKSKIITQPSTQITEILDKIKSFITVQMFEIQQNLEFSSSYNKKKSLDSLINEKILPLIKEINDINNNINSNKYAQFQPFLNNFNDYSSIAIEKLNSETIINTSQNVLNSLKETIETEILNYLKQSFNNLKPLIDLTLKNVVEKRNLVEVKNNKIQSAFDLYKNDYFQICNEFNKANEINDLQKEYSNFLSILNNIFKNVGNPITNSLDYLEKELNQTQYLNFKEKLNIQLKNIKDSVNNLINKESNIIDESLNLIKVILPKLFISNQNSFKSSIDDSLLNLYETAMKNVEKINKKYSAIRNNIKVGSYKALFPGNVYHIINNAVNQLKSEYSIKLIYNNDFTFTVYLYTNNELYLDSTFETKNVLKGGFKGTIANISTTISSHNNFAIERVNFKAINTNQAVFYNNWIQYKNVRKSKCKWYTLCIGRKRWLEWGEKKSWIVYANPTLKSIFEKIYEN